MKAIEFEATLTAGQQSLALPAGIAAQLPPGQTLRILVLVEENDEAEAAAAWKRLAAEQFFKGYSDDDAIYDRYDELSGR